MRSSDGWNFKEIKANSWYERKIIACTNLSLKKGFHYPEVKKSVQAEPGLFHFYTKNIGNSREQHISKGKVVSRSPSTLKELLLLV